MDFAAAIPTLIPVKEPGPVVTTILPTAESPPGVCSEILSSRGMIASACPRSINNLSVATTMVRLHLSKYKPQQRRAQCRFAKMSMFSPDARGGLSHLFDGFDFRYVMTKQVLDTVLERRGRRWTA